MTKPIRYVGDLSKNDAKLLRDLAGEGKNILEFGMGGSTQIFAQCNPARLVSLETDDKWIERTRKNLETLGVADKAELVKYPKIHLMTCDLIFVDGIWSERSNFMHVAWHLLGPMKCMVVHDTRRDFDAQMVCEFLKLKYDEIFSVHWNISDSNCTVITKGQKSVYENWNIGMEPWQHGDGEVGPLEDWLLI